MSACEKEAGTHAIVKKNEKRKKRFVRNTLIVLVPRITADKIEPKQHVKQLSTIKMQ
jgi:hypothetical protein